MMMSSLIAAALVAGQYQYPSTSQSEVPASTAQSFDPGPVVAVYRKCFEQAEKTVKAAAPDVKQREFDACVAARQPIIDHVAAKLEQADRDTARRALDRAFSGVEKRFAKRMLVTMKAQ